MQILLFEVIPYLSPNPTPIKYAFYVSSTYMYEVCPKKLQE